MRDFGGASPQRFRGCHLCVCMCVCVCVCVCMYTYTCACIDSHIPVASGLKNPEARRHPAHSDWRELQLLFWRQALSTWASPCYAKQIGAKHPYLAVKPYLARRWMVSRQNRRIRCWGRGLGRLLEGRRRSRGTSLGAIRVGLGVFVCLCLSVCLSVWTSTCYQR